MSDTREPVPPMAAPAPESGSGGSTCAMPPVDFSGFAISLAESALIDLGEIPHPETNQRQKNLAQACHTIDTLAMLQEKTRGNLMPDEAHLIDGLLYKLRLIYLEAR